MSEEIHGFMEVAKKSYDNLTLVFTSKRIIVAKRTNLRYFVELLALLLGVLILGSILQPSLGGGLFGAMIAGGIGGGIGFLVSHYISKGIKKLQKPAKILTLPPEEILKVNKDNFGIDNSLIQKIELIKGRKHITTSDIIIKTIGKDYKYAIIRIPEKESEFKDYVNLVQKTVLEKVEVPKAQKGIPKIIPIAIIIFTLIGGWYGYSNLYLLTPAGTYSNYGISFDYPAQSQIKEVGYLTDNPNEDSGTITITWKEERLEHVFSLTWARSLTGTIEGSLDGMLRNIENSEAVLKMIEGERSEITLNNHILSYQLFDLEYNQNFYQCVISITFFDEVKKFFIFQYITETEGPLSRLIEVVDTLKVSQTSL